MFAKTTLSPVVPVPAPPPATVFTVPLRIRRTTAPSPTYTAPDASVATADGNENRAVVAVKLSTRPFVLPVPASVVTLKVSVSMARIVKLPLSQT